MLNSETTSVFLGQITAHHFYIGSTLICSGAVGLLTHAKIHPNAIDSWHAHLGFHLAMTGSWCIGFAHHMYAIPMYPYCASDYPTLLCLFYHHIWVGGFLIIGAGAHASIFFIICESSIHMSLINHVLKHRDVIIGHLIWVSIGHLS